MQTFNTFSDIVQASTEVRHHRDGSVACYRPPAAPWQWRCATCGGLFAENVPHGQDPDGGLHCYDCCHTRDLEALRDRSRPFGGYISTDGRTLINWTGRALGRVVSASTYRNNWGARVHCYTIRDAHGGYWHGRGAGPGMYVRLRPSKT